MVSKLQFLMYFIISVFSTFLAVACTSDNDVPFPDIEAPSIDFEGSALTRGIVNTADDMSAFDVWGWYSPISGTGTARQVFDATLVSRNGTTWTYDNIQRWQQGNSYQFYAIYPSFDAECGYKSASCDQKGTFTINNFDCSKTGDEAVDLMTAVRSVECGTDGYPGKVSMPFQHELAKVDIVGQSEGSDAYITGIQLTGITSTGNYVMSEWKLDKTEIVTYTKDGFSLPAVPTNIFGSLLLIPQSVKDIQLSITYEFPGIANSSQTQILSLPATPDKWERGKHYQYSFTLKGNYIIFNSPQVNEWKEASGGIIIVA